MPVQELPKGVDPAVVRKMVDESRAQYESLEQAWDRLLEDHEGEWVAAFHGDFVFGTSIEKVLAEAKSRGWPLGVIAIDQLRRERADVLL